MFTWTKCIQFIQLLSLVTIFALSSRSIFADTIKVNPTAQYASDAVGTQQVRDQCDWNKLIIEYLVSYSRGRVEVTNADLATIPGKTLSIVITKVHTAGGGGYSGPKWGYAEVTLMDNGQAIQKFEMGGKTNMGRAWTACGELDRIAKVIARKTAKRLAHPRLSKQPKIEPAEESDQDTDTEDSEKK